MSNAAPDNGSKNQRPLTVNVANTLEYNYRDVFNITAGPEDVVIEFGNVNRSQTDQVTVFNRIVVSPGTAMRLAQGLQQSLNQMQEEIKKQMAARNATQR